MSQQVNITLPDGSVRTYDSGITIKQVAESIGKNLGKAAIAGIIDGGDTAIDVHTPLTKDAALKIVTVKTEAGLPIVRHTTAHLMAMAVQKLFPGTQVTIGPSIENGFYYDFYREQGPFTPDDLPKIEEEMHRIAKQNVPMVREVVTRDAVKERFSKMGERFKLEIIDAIPADDTITVYTLGDWPDVCRGPHVPDSSWLKAFKLTSVAGAYWRGDERNPMLTRIYGTAFWTEEELAKHVELQEEAKRRDHRKLGKELDLFFFHPYAPATPFFTDKGARIYNGLVDFIRAYYGPLDMGEVITPQLTDSELFKTSGHYANYKDNMYFAQIDEREFGMKPMNCPGHMLMFGHTKHSYRDLPIRMADFGRLHRYERSGVTAGLTRVRSFCQDDAHLFVREDQIGEEIRLQLAMLQDVYAVFGLEMKVQLSTRPEKSLGREPGLSAEESKSWDKAWENAEGMLRTALADNKLEFELNAGDGAFYGPKLDFQVKDALGRWFQLGTIQLDYGLPRRFQLSYTNEQSGESTPVVIHRAILGSLERFIGILLEHTAGDLPLWLAPTQVRLITINDELLGYGREIQAALEEKSIRVHLDERSEKLGFKIRDAELNKVPVVMVLGAKEREARSVSVRWRKKGDLGVMPLDKSIQLVLDAATVPKPDRAKFVRKENLVGASHS
ncbi:MAG: threonine--tRNA ligase [Myxococcota bacterium]